MELKVFQSTDESHPDAVALDCTIAFCFELKVFQSVDESAPVVVEVASARRSEDHENEIPVFGVHIVTNPGVLTGIIFPLASTLKNVPFPGLATDHDVS